MRPGCSCVLCVVGWAAKLEDLYNVSKLPVVHWFEDTVSKSDMVCCVSITSDAFYAVSSWVSLPMWANCHSVPIEVNVIHDRTDISLELTTTWASPRAPLLPQSHTNATEAHLNMTRAVHLQLWMDSAKDAKQRGGLIVLMKLHGEEASTGCRSQLYSAGRITLYQQFGSLILFVLYRWSTEQWGVKSFQKSILGAPHIC